MQGKVPTSFRPDITITRTGTPTPTLLELKGGVNSSVKPASKEGSVGGGQSDFFFPVIAGHPSLKNQDEGERRLGLFAPPSQFNQQDLGLDPDKNDDVEVMLASGGQKGVSGPGEYLIPTDLKQYYIDIVYHGIEELSAMTSFGSIIDDRMALAKAQVNRNNSHYQNAVNFVALLEQRNSIEDIIKLAFHVRYSRPYQDYPKEFFDHEFKRLGLDTLSMMGKEVKWQQIEDVMERVIDQEIYHNVMIHYINNAFDSRYSEIKNFGFTNSDQLRVTVLKYLYAALRSNPDRIFLFISSLIGEMQAQIQQNQLTRSQKAKKEQAIAILEKFKKTFVLKKLTPENQCQSPDDFVMLGGRRRDYYNLMKRYKNVATLKAAMKKIMSENLYLQFDVMTDKSSFDEAANLVIDCLSEKTQLARQFLLTYDENLFENNFGDMAFFTNLQIELGELKKDPFDEDIINNPEPEDFGKSLFANGIFLDGKHLGEETILYGHFVKAFEQCGNAKVLTRALIALEDHLGIHFANEVFQYKRFDFTVKMVVLRLQVMINKEFEKEFERFHYARRLLKALELLSEDNSFAFDTEHEFIKALKSVDDVVLVTYGRYSPITKKDLQAIIDGFASMEDVRAYFYEHRAYYGDPHKRPFFPEDLKKYLHGGVSFSEFKQMLLKHFIDHPNDIFQFVNDLGKAYSGRSGKRINPVAMDFYLQIVRNGTAARMEGRVLSFAGNGASFDQTRSLVSSANQELRGIGLEWNKNQNHLQMLNGRAFVDFLSDHFSNRDIYNLYQFSDLRHGFPGQGLSRSYFMSEVLDVIMKRASLPDFFEKLLSFKPELQNRFQNFQLLISKDLQNKDSKKGFGEYIVDDVYKGLKNKPIFHDVFREYLKVILDGKVSELSKLFSLAGISVSNGDFDTVFRAGMEIAERDFSHVIGSNGYLYKIFDVLFTRMDATIEDAYDGFMAMMMAYLVSMVK